MQTLEKIVHAPMPFTSGGQTITDRINAAKHSLAGSQLGKTICKATTEELMAPKKKHLDYLLHCTNEPNVSIPSMANLLIERTQNPNWVVVYKALITIHNMMCYGNERFSQYLASCNTTFNLTNFVDKSNLSNGGAIAAGYDMSTHVRRYGKYISEKIHAYRLCAFDFCKVKRGRDDGLLRTLHTEKLLKTMPILQAQIDSLLEFQVSSSELNNGVINCSFILLFRDLIRLFACYNDGVINLLEKFFDMNKKQCREALDLYKAFLARLDRVQAFLSTAETVGIERGEIPDLTRAPASLLEALESHLYHLEGGRGPPPSTTQQMVSQQIYSAQQQQEQFYQQQQQQQQQSSAMTAASFAASYGGYGYGGGNGGYAGGGGPGTVDEAAKQRYLEEEKERLRQYEEEQRRRQPPHQQQQPGPVPNSSANPFGGSSSSSAMVHPMPTAPGGAADLLFFDTPPQKGGQPQQQQQAQPMDASNPFAMVAELNSRTQLAPPAANPFMAPAPSVYGGGPPAGNPFSAPPPSMYSGNMMAGGYPGQQPPAYWAQSAGPIYSQTPFSGADGSYTAPSMLQQGMDHHQGQAAPQRPPPPSMQQQQFAPQWPAPGPSNGTGGGGGGADLPHLVSNLAISASSSSSNAGQYSAGPGQQQWPGSGNPFGAASTSAGTGYAPSTNPF